jgi:type VII secretion protein EccB
MQSRRDQVQAHRFTLERLSAGMLVTEPDAPETPLSRTSRGILIGTVLGALAAAGFLIFGLVMPGGATGWKHDGTLVVENETGARFLYAGGALRPVSNYTSVKLLVGDRLQVQRVSAKSLQGTARGTAVGIAGAPDSLPAAAALLADRAWQVCSGRQQTVTGGTATRTALDVGAATTAPALTRAQGLLVAGSGKAQYLLWNGLRFRLKNGGGGAHTLGYGTVQPYPVSDALLNAVPAGPDLAAPKVPGAGKPGPSLTGRKTRIGGLFVVHPAGGTDQYYQLRREGLTPISSTVADLVQADGATAPATLDPATVTAHLAGAPAGSDGLPATPPRPATVGDAFAVCVRVTPRDTSPLTEIVVAPAGDAGAGGPMAAGPGITRPCDSVDVIGVPPGHGTLAEALPAAGYTGAPATYLVTDQGVKYPLPSADAAKNLGYGSVAPAKIPGSVLALLPAGPTLDPAVVASGTSVTPLSKPAAGCSK